MRMMEESEENRKIIACVSEGSDIYVEQKMQCYMAASQELSGLDRRQVEMMECGLGWAVEARRNRGGTERE